MQTVTTAPADIQGVQSSSIKLFLGLDFRFTVNLPKSNHNPYVQSMLPIHHGNKPDKHKFAV